MKAQYICEENLAIAKALVGEADPATVDCLAVCDRDLLTLVRKQFAHWAKDMQIDAQILTNITTALEKLLGREVTCSSDKRLGIYTFNVKGEPELTLSEIAGSCFVLQDDTLIADRAKLETALGSRDLVLSMNDLLPLLSVAFKVHALYWWQSDDGLIVTCNQRLSVSVEDLAVIIVRDIQRNHPEKSVHTSGGSLGPMTITTAVSHQITLPVSWFVHVTNTDNVPATLCALQTQLSRRLHVPVHLFYAEYVEGKPNGVASFTYKGDGNDDL